MRQYSERQGVIRELFTLLLLQHDDDNDDLITQMYSLPGSPTIGTLLFPDDPEMMFVIDELFNDKADLGELIQTIMSSRYLNTRAPPVFRDEFDLARLFQMRSVDFKQATRTTKEADQGGDEDENTDSNSDVSPNEADMHERFRNKIKRQCRKRNYELGTLPIP
ncbi:hypothetical protein H4Q26_003538 [Puccinia striiformis f. sp. tritici PST-130]|nr:hypothetical protein H4Q26_003538 [Puccinia striiformis f. sp. tritici PST-130]